MKKLFNILMVLGVFTFTTVLLSTVSQASSTDGSKLTTNTYTPKTKSIDLDTEEVSQLKTILQDDNVKVASSDSNADAKQQLTALVAKAKISGQVKSKTKVTYYPGTSIVEGEEVLSYVTISYSKSYSVTYEITSRFGGGVYRTYKYTTY